jgi:hypothetical protein
VDETSRRWSSDASAVTGRNASSPRLRAVRRDLHPRVGRRLTGRPLAGEVRPERDGRFGVERDVDLAQRLERIEVAVDAVQRLLLLGVAEVHAEDLLAALERVLVDAPGLLLLGEDRHRQAAGHRRRHGLQETPPSSPLAL